MKKIFWLIFCCYLFLPLISYADSPCELDGNSDVIAECTKEIQSGKHTGEDLAWYYDIRAQAWMQKGEHDKALSDANEALRLNPDWSEALLHRGNALQAKQLYDLANNDYSRVIKLARLSIEAYTMRGSLYGIMGKLDEAIADSTLALNGIPAYESRYDSKTKNDPYFNPSKARPLFNRGLAWKLKGEYHKAIADYQLAIRSNPGNPLAWEKQTINWNKKSLAEQADRLYKNIGFSPDINTSDSRIYDIRDVQKTRYGNVLLIQANILPASAIMFNGQIVYEAQGMYVGIWGYFKSKNADVILISANPGGSATPDTELSFLVINSEGQTKVISNPGFVANSPDANDIKTSTDVAGRIFVNFGFRAGKEMIAELDSGKLVIHANLKKNMSLDHDNCKWLYDKGMESCTSEIAHEQGCSNYASNAGVYDSVSDMTQKTFISNLPGYSQAGFNKSCFAWCNSKKLSYAAFRKATCSIR